ncbi:MAG: hypothetical protein ACK4M0_11330, partial [Phreatobacter sp.]
MVAQLTLQAADPPPADGGTGLLDRVRPGQADRGVGNLWSGDITVSAGKAPPVCVMARGEPA